ncbi:hypothetical protein Pelo_15416 [Pelomyxa schiedti]|nr:hypothetical protein Pelo_15416 [Pelomyxa schiedti]
MANLRATSDAPVPAVHLAPIASDSDSASASASTVKFESKDNEELAGSKRAVGSGSVSDEVAEIPPKVSRKTVLFGGATVVWVLAQLTPSRSGTAFGFSTSQRPSSVLREYATTLEAESRRLFLAGLKSCNIINPHEARQITINSRIRSHLVTWVLSNEAPRVLRNLLAPCFCRGVSWDIPGKTPIFYHTSDIRHILADCVFLPGHSLKEWSCSFAVSDEDGKEAGAIPMEYTTQDSPPDWDAVMTKLKCRPCLNIVQGIGALGACITAAQLYSPEIDRCCRVALIAQCLISEFPDCLTPVATERGCCPIELYCSALHIETLEYLIALNTTFNKPLGNLRLLDCWDAKAFQLVT